MLANIVFKWLALLICICKLQNSHFEPHTSCQVAWFPAIHLGKCQDFTLNSASNNCFSNLFQFTIPPPINRWQWRSKLRQRATTRKLAGSIPAGVTRIFHQLNPSGRTMPLGVDSASNRNEYERYILGGKDDLTTFMCRLSRNSRSLNLLES